MAPDGVSVHATRVFLEAVGTGPNLTKPMALAPLRTYVKPPLLDDGTALIAAAPTSVIAYAFTSTSCLGEGGDDDALRERLERSTRGVPIVTPTCLTGHPSGACPSSPRSTTWARLRWTTGCGGPPRTGSFTCRPPGDPGSRVCAPPDLPAGALHDPAPNL